MDTTILEVVLGLALVYAMLSVLVMKLQEEVGGKLLNYRANVLHDLLKEGTGQDDELKKNLLQNPLVSALYRGAAAEQRTLRDSGPSAIPPSLFARALLAELNGGAAPALAHANPAAFFSASAPAVLLGGAGGRNALGGAPAPGAAATGGAAVAAAAGGVAASGVGNLRIWQALQTLLPGNEASWAGYEAAIAQWFSDIGDRSDGWFKRKASWWTLSLSAILVVLLNVDSFHMAGTLATDPALRLGLADLATRVDSQRRSDAAGQGDTAAPPSAAAQPMQQLASRMTDAITRLNSAYFSDPRIRDYRADLAPVSLSCSIVQERSGLDEPAPKASAPASGPARADKTSPAATKAATAAAAKASAAAASKATSAVVVKGVLAGQAMLSNADIWLRVLPVLQAKVEVAQLLGAADAARTYRRGFECAAQISAWVRSATVATNNAATRSLMQEAAVALESVKSALLTLAERQQAGTAVQRAFLADPQAFDTCRSDARSRSAFDACLQRELRAGFPLPLLWGGAASRQQFCRVASGSVGAGAAVPQAISVTITLPAAAAASGMAAAAASAVATAQAMPVAVAAAATSGWPCNVPAFAGDPRLDLPELRLVRDDVTMSLLAAGAGWFVTVLFVALGAPFWFDLLSKVVRLRSAGTVRDAAADVQRGSGTLALPVVVTGSGTGSSSGAAGTGAEAQAPFSDSRNGFEDGLQPADRLRLQQALGTTQSGRLDGPTRAAISAWCAANGVTPVVDVLDAPLFLRIVGRPASQSGATSGNARPAAGQVHASVPMLAAALMPVLRQNGRIAAGTTVFDADLRALAVLFRYDQERAAGTAPQHSRVLQLPRRNPAALDEIDDVLAAEIADAAANNRRRTLEPPCWMDWAIGELGQVEVDARSRAGSNQRICAYLDEAQANAGDDGDHTPWCGAFVAWVLKRYSAYCTAHAADNARAGDPLAAVAAAGAGALAAIQPVAAPLLASSWASWGAQQFTTPATWQANARFGDIVLFKPQQQGSSGHVAFVVAWDGQDLWALGGNQTKGSRVSMEPWDASQVVAVMRAP